MSVTAGGREAKRLVVGSEEGIDQALLETTCELLEVKPAPAVVTVVMAEHHGTSIVSVLVDDGVARQAGPAVVRGNRPRAVAKAFWSAVSRSA